MWGSDIVGLQAEDESVRFGSDAGFAAATAGESEKIIRLHEVSDSAFPPLPNSSHNSCLRLSTSACARASCSAGACAGAAARVCPVSSSSAVSGRAEDLRPVSEVKAGVKFSAGRPGTGAGCRFTSREATRN